MVQTGLHWAAWGAHIDVMRLLLERGAPVDAKENRFHAQALDMALWTWGNDPHNEVRDRCYAAIALLAQAGAKLDRAIGAIPRKTAPPCYERSTPTHACWLHSAAR